MPKLTGKKTVGTKVAKKKSATPSPKQKAPKVSLKAAPKGTGQTKAKSGKPVARKAAPTVQAKAKTKAGTHSPKKGANKVQGKGKTTTAPKTKTFSATPHGSGNVIWKLLEARRLEREKRQQEQSSGNRFGRESDNGGRSADRNQTKFGRFAGPRRRAA